MPELPEVEVARMGIAPRITGRTLSAIIVREPRLRWPVSDAVRRLAGRVVSSVGRRGKYLLIGCGDGHLVVHLGMSGSLRFVAPGALAGPHDHVDIVLGNQVLRLRDPRRFGAVLWVPGDARQHPLLARLGVEPLGADFNGPRLHAITRAHRNAVKVLLMDAQCIVGIGNIYASESLYRARIRPSTRANRLTPERCVRLAQAIKVTLRAAIRAGGSSLRDFTGAGGEHGCFQQRYRVYDRAGLPCRECGASIRRIVQAQRSSYYCPRCQR